MSWNDVLLFFQKWGLEFLLGGFGVALTAVARHYWKLAKKSKIQEDLEKKETFKKELTSEVKQLIKDVREQVRREIKDESTQVREEIAEYETNDGERIETLETKTTVLENTLSAVVESLELIKGGLLAVQGHEFRNKCRKLLAQDVIMPDEFEQLESDHLAYNGLGGNHKGDSLFAQVKVKYFAQLEANAKNTQ